MMEYTSKLTGPALEIGFTGTREGMTTRQLRTVAQVIFGHCLVEYRRTSLHHGDCIGADEEVHALARAARFRIIIHPPERDKYRAFCQIPKGHAADILKPLPYLVRNRQIVHSSDVLIAAPFDGVKKGSGTWATVQYAMRQDMPIYICWPDGRMTFEGVNKL